MIVVEQPQYMNRNNPEKESLFDGVGVNYEDMTPEMRIAQAQAPVATPIQSPVTFEQEREFIKARTGEAPIPAQSPAATPPAKGYPTRQTIQPQNNAVSAYDRVRQVMNTSIPKPTYDPNRPEEMKRLARASALAKGFNLIGDVIGVTQKANVQRRQPNNNELAYLDNTYKYLDDYSRRLDDWNYKDFVNRLRGAELGVQQENIAADNARRERYERAQQDRFDKEFNYQQEKDKNALSDYEAKLTVEQKFKLEEIEARRKAEASLIGQRNAAGGSGGSGGSGADGLIEIKTKNKIHRLTPTELSYYHRMALKNAPELMKTNPELFQIEYSEIDGKPTGNFTIAKQASDEHLVAAMLELEERREATKYEDPKNRPAYPGAPLREGESLPKNQPGEAIKMIKSGNLDSAYTILKGSGYSDEAIKKFFDKVTGEQQQQPVNAEQEERPIISGSSPVQPQQKQPDKKPLANTANTIEKGFKSIFEGRNQQQNENIVDVDNKYKQKYPPELAELFDNSFAPGMKDRAPYIAQQLARREGKQGDELLIAIKEYTPLIQQDIDAYENEIEASKTPISAQFDPKSPNYGSKFR